MKCPYRDERSWRESVPSRYLEPSPHPAFVYVQKNPLLPDVLIIGDSISMSYTPGVRERLRWLANVYRAPDNCRSTEQTLEALEEYLGDRNWEVIHFNFGIHDVTLTGGDGRSSPSGSPRVPLDEYRENLERIITRLESTGARLIWASTTPVADDVELRKNDHINMYNRAALEIARRRGVCVNDLHGIVAGHEKPLWRDGVHFSSEGAAILAEAAALKIRDGEHINSPVASPDVPLIIAGGDKKAFTLVSGFDIRHETEEGATGPSLKLRIIGNGAAGPGDITIILNGNVLGGAAVSPARASQLYHFDYAVEPGVLKKGINEIEILTSPSSAGLYMEDMRLEFSY